MHRLSIASHALARPKFALSGAWPIERTYQHAALLVALAVATPLAFAPYYHFWLMPVIFALVILQLEARPDIVVRSAYLYGLCSYSAQFYWVHTALHDVSGLANLYALPLTLLLPAYLALYPAGCFWLLSKCALPRTWRIGVFLPIVWTWTEFLRERLFTGFGWGAIGYSQIADHSPLAGYAPLGGVHLVSFVCALSAALLALTWRSRVRIKISAIALLILLLGGGWQLRSIDFTVAQATRASVALLQGNVAQHLKWTSAARENTLRTYYDMLRQHPADIVILPETAIPMLRENLQSQYPEVLAQFAQTARQQGSALALGIAQYTDDRRGYHNAVLNLAHYQSAQTASIPYYAKNHLVPFGEYKPLPLFTEFLYRHMHMPLTDFARGGKAQAPLQLANQQVAFNICYEDGFGDELIASARQASLLANVSNMAWYGSSNAMYQQVQQSQARALELGRYMVRATNTGVTAIIDPKGRIVAQLPADIQAVLHGEVTAYRGATPYMRMGGSWPLLIVLAAMALTTIAIHRKKS